MNVTCINYLEDIPKNIWDDNILHYLEEATGGVISRLSHRCFALTEDFLRFHSFPFAFRAWVQNSFDSNVSYNNLYKFICQKEKDLENSLQIRTNYEEGKSFHERARIMGVMQGKYIVKALADLLEVCPIDQPNQTVYKEHFSHDSPIIKIVDPYIITLCNNGATTEIALHRPFQQSAATILEELKNPSSFYKYPNKNCMILDDHLIVSFFESKEGPYKKPAHQKNYIWNLTTGKLKGFYSGRVLDLSTNAMQQNALSLLHKGVIKSVTLGNSLQLREDYLTPSSPIVDGTLYQKYFLTLHKDHYVRLWDRQTGKMIKNLCEMDSEKHVFLDNPFRPVLLPTSDDNQKMTFLSLSSEITVQSLPFQSTIQTRLSSNLSVVKDGLFAFYTSDGNIDLVDLKSSQINPFTLKTGDYFIRKEKLFIDIFGKETLVIGDNYNKIVAFNKKKGEPRYQLKVPNYVTHILNMKVICDTVELNVLTFEED